MNLRRFLDAGFALLYEIKDRAASGVDGLAILDGMQPWAAGSDGLPAETVAEQRKPTENAESMALLESVLAQVQGAPKRKPRKA